MKTVSKGHVHDIRYKQYYKQLFNIHLKYHISNLDNSIRKCRCKIVFLFYNTDTLTEITLNSDFCSADICFLQRETHFLRET